MQNDSDDLAFGVTQKTRTRRRRTGNGREQGTKEKTHCWGWDELEDSTPVHPRMPQEKRKQESFQPKVELGKVKVPFSARMERRGFDSKWP